MIVFRVFPSSLNPCNAGKWPGSCPPQMLFPQPLNQKSDPVPPSYGKSFLLAEDKKRFTDMQGLKERLAVSFST